MSLWGKFLLVCVYLFAALSMSAQCYNADFEQGSFSGWQGYRGNCCPINLTNTGIVNGRHTIMTQGIDPNTCGGLSTVYSGNFSARLGNSNVGAQSEALHYTFNVTPQNTLVQYAYAVVFEDPGHLDEEQPRFNTRVRLQDGSVVQCTDYMVTSASNLPGYQYCLVNGESIAWKDWTLVSLDLTDYIGQSVTLEFETGDCSLGGHFGYAYIDAISCAPTEINVQYCVDQTNAIISAPTGFESYLWENGETTSTIEIDPTLYDSISCFITTVTGCELTLITSLEPTLPVASFNYSGVCLGEEFVFANTSTVSDNSPLSYIWNFGDGSTSTLENPTHVYNLPGFYNVTLNITTDNGCNDQISQIVEVISTPVSSFIVSDNCFGDNTNFINTTIPVPGYQITTSWNFGNGVISSNDISPIYTYPSPGAYTVQLISSIGSCVDVFEQVVNIQSNPVASFILQDGCQGSQTQFLNTTAIPDWAVNNQYLWSFGEFGATSLLESPNYTYSTEGIFDVSLLVVSTNGSISCESQLTQDVQIYPNPNVSFITSGNSCVNTEVTFTNLSTISQTSEIINYIWNFGDGVISNVPNPTHTYNSPGIYNVTLTATSNFGCIRTSQSQITIYSLPNVSSNSGEICQGNIFNLSANGAIFYNWSPSNNLNSVVGANVSANPNSTTVYTVTGTDINGCSSTSQSIVSVNSLPNIVVNSPTICQGELVQLNAIGANSYTWFPNINLSNNNQNSVICDSENSIQYTVTGTDINGCVNTAVSNVTVVPLPIIAVSSGTVCQGESINLNASGANSYTWSPQLYLNTTIGPDVTSTPLQNITYTVTGIGDNNCISTAQSTVLVNPISDISFNPVGAAGCPPLVVNFSDFSSGNINSWVWTFGDGTFSNEQNPSHVYNNSGNYSVTLQVTTNDGCISSETSNNIINVYPTPSANFTVYPLDTDEYNPNISTFNYSIGGISYFWDFGDQTYSNLFEPEHMYQNSGIYYITLDVYNQYGCVDSASTQIKINPIFTYYIPNAFTPTDDTKNETFFGKGTGYKTVTMQIFNRWGEKIYEETSLDPSWDGKLNGVDCQIDVYVYQFYVTDIFNETHLYRGRVSLIR
jgi:gliding motility-associated-like protein